MTQPKYKYRPLYCVYDVFNNGKLVQIRCATFTGLKALKDINDIDALIQRITQYICGETKHFDNIVIKFWKRLETESDALNPLWEGGGQ